MLLYLIVPILCFLEQRRRYLHPLSRVHLHALQANGARFPFRFLPTQRPRPPTLQLPPPRVHVKTSQCVPALLFFNEQEAAIFSGLSSKSSSESLESKS